ncbi:NAD(P)H-hydrate dehydratase [uncultured Maritimibacter sp.]|uniref:NAD(P)H-hydrate dehydratase n=1 Tax=uncultured Maritimibacter sp. TaxID=991866 RepID=UPI0025951700|nr:NAD(P)H-hydrate dehydratase [uncultured Maritimibacter sp.]
MSELVTAAQMRAIEQAAISSGKVTGLALMERAGQGVVQAICETWPELTEGANGAVVLCGPGNNGGDGYVVARLLAARGWSVAVFAYGDPARLPPDARTNYERWCRIGVCAPLSALDDTTFRNAAVTVDALFGTGLTRPLPVEVLNALMFASTRPNAAAPQRPPMVAVDIASGVDADSGRVIGGDEQGDELPYWPALTVTFGAAKVGHMLLPYAGDTRHKLVVAPIGVEDDIARAYLTWNVVEHLDLAAVRHIDLLGRPDISLQALQLAKDVASHKFGHGHAVILSGPAGRTGAARLAARAALRIGAGLVTVAAPRDAMAENAAQLNAIMLREAEGAEALADLLQDKRLNAICLGPGLGQPRARDLVPVALDATRDRDMGGVVLDADALSAFANDPVDLFKMLHDGCVLTPHAGEFARLFPDLSARLNAPATAGPAYSKVDAARDAAERAGCTVLLKGPDTVIADETGDAAINAACYDRAAPWLATAGSGDVLTGLVTGLLARGYAPVTAAETAAWLHTEAALSFGPGLIAEDLPEELPKVFRALGV